MRMLLTHVSSVFRSKILILILALCQIIGCFSACKKDQGNTSGDIKFDLTKDNLAEYKIVIPSGNIEMNAVAIMLQGMIEKVIGTKLDIKIDKIEEGSDTYCETEYEILLGYVNRSQVREFYPSVKNNDLGYALVGKKIIILGYDTQGYVKVHCDNKCKSLLKRTDQIPNGNWHRKFGPVCFKISLHLHT